MTALGSLNEKTLTMWHAPCRDSGISASGGVVRDIGSYLGHEATKPI